MYLNDVELADDKLTIDESSILEEGRGHVQVEVLIKVLVEVFGKGKDYSTTVEVQPTSTVEQLKQKVSFMKLFIQRKHSLLIKSSEKVIDDFQKTFQEYDIKDGT